VLPLPVDLTGVNVGSTFGFIKDWARNIWPLTWMSQLRDPHYSALLTHRHLRALCNASAAHPRFNPYVNSYAHGLAVGVGLLDFSLI